MSFAETVIEFIILLMLGLFVLIIFLSILFNLCKIIYKIIRKIYKWYSSFHIIIPREDQEETNLDTVNIKEKEVEEYIIIKNPYNQEITIGSISKRLSHMV